MGKEYPVLNKDPVPKKTQPIYENRLRQFIGSGGQYGDLNLPHFYDYDRTDNKDNVKLEVYSVPGLARPKFKEVMEKAKWKDARKGQSFGPTWSTHWFRIHIRVPWDWRRADQVIFNWDSGDEGFIFTEEGHAVVGLSGQERKEWIVPHDWQMDGKWHLFYIETSCNQMTGAGSPPDPNKYFRLNRADLVWPNLEARALYIDFWLLGDAAREFPGSSWQKHKARELGNRIMDTFDPENADETIKECRKIAAEFFGDVNSASVYDNDNENHVYAIGNCHIDTAWLWPFAETHRKVARSWASQLDLIERYPEYVFVASQIQQFYWLKEDHPELFKRVQKAVKDGRFIPIGGSWVECDSNMPSGESLSRQFLLGQRFFEANFGSRTKTFWLPDTFGYAPQIPQFCRLVGIDRFLTQKLSWNSVNNFPNSSFNWVALDGSQVVCHMPPNNTYTASAHFGDVRRSLEQHKNLDLSQTGMLLYGHGDGGGGPTAEMIEKLRRCRGISDTSGLLPRIKSGITVDEFYDIILKETNNGQDLVSWVGELYLEYHRGTYTTQAAIKRGNRFSEVLMHDVEYLATIASIYGKDYDYPTREIDECWQDICLNQFHDVLPGSGIEMIYEDARAIYDSVFSRGKALIQGALDALGIHPDAQEGTVPVLLNTLPWSRDVVIEVQDPKDSMQTTSEGKKITLARVSSGISELSKAITARVSYGSDLRIDTKARKLLAHGQRAVGEELATGKIRLDNGFFTVIINEEGTIDSIYDQIDDREVLDTSRGKGNQYVIFDDQPLSFPAWDTDQYSLGTRRELTGGHARLIEKGPIQAVAKMTQKISDKSSLVTTLTMNLGSRLIEFETHVDWHEKYKFLKVEFPVDVINDTATYETSYGAQKRPTHFNTSWETAKFEVCGHKWADLSDHTYGVALINDCKYGYSIHGNLMRLSLLRSPKSPDAHADMGKHAFRYALFPHSGPVSSEVVIEAFNFNHTISRFHKDPGLENRDLNLVQLKGTPSLIMSTIKRHEDDKEVSRGILPVRQKGTNVIVRVYDSLGGRARGRLCTSKPIKKAFKVNILEDDIEEIPANGNEALIELRQFEIATYRLELDV
ncbi:alpha-mannosidase [Trichomonascus vanleenenianus]|uniref:alpha-mannosidase n=1 Tax=Trichomonascus vanleenenianus TaxID=2268995 RepID=UPI003EC96BF4